MTRLWLRWRKLRNLITRNVAEVDAVDGCCDCGGKGGVWEFYGATDFGWPNQPDWMMCDPCYNHTSDAMRELPHYRVGRYLPSRVRLDAWYTLVDQGIKVDFDAFMDTLDYVVPHIIRAERNAAREAMEAL